MEKIGTGHRSRERSSSTRIIELRTDERECDSLRRECLELRERVRLLEFENEKLKMYHPLTGILSKSGLEREFQKFRQRLILGQITTLSVVYIDLCGFKKVNDNLGHEGGDEVLKIVASTFQRLIDQRKDAVAHLSGDEFALIITSIGSNTTKGVVTALRKEVQSIPVYDGDSRIELDFTDGVKLLTRGNSSSFAEALHASDTHMLEKRRKAKHKNFR